jgi:hypothetical protein
MGGYTDLDTLIFVSLIFDSLFSNALISDALAGDALIIIANRAEAAQPPLP